MNYTINCPNLNCKDGTAINDCISCGGTGTGNLAGVCPICKGNGYKKEICSACIGLSEVNLFDYIEFRNETEREELIEELQEWSGQEEIYIEDKTVQIGMKEIDEAGLIDFFEWTKNPNKE